VKSDQQATVDRLRSALKKQPARMNRLRVQWDKACELLAGYFIAERLKSFEAHHRMERGRIAMFVAIEAGKAEKSLWIYAMHGAGYPAAPHPRAKIKAPA
jgi:hypothetical protein